MIRSALAFGALAASLVAPAAAAEIYECVGPDGRKSFTSDPSQCAGARPHELKREIHKADPSRRVAGRRLASPAARAGGAEARGLEQMWRRKLAEARKQLDEVEALHERRRVMVKACNQGSTWWRPDASGIRSQVPCDDLKREFAELEAERAKLRAYVEGGIQEECRRAGCLPGWLR